MGKIKIPSDVWVGLYAELSAYVEEYGSIDNRYDDNGNRLEEYEDEFLEIVNNVEEIMSSFLEREEDNEELYPTDYVIIDSDTKKPIEGYEHIYHYTSVIDHFNERVMDNNEGWQYVSMSELSDEDKKNFKKTIKEMEEFRNECL